MPKLFIHLTDHETGARCAARWDQIQSITEVCDDDGKPCTAVFFIQDDAHGLEVEESCDHILALIDEARGAGS